MEEIVKKEYIEGDDTLVFATTSVVKVVLLSLATFGFYHIILAFSYWKQLKNNFGHKVSPFWRALFLGFSNFALFPIFEKYLNHFNQKVFNPAALAIIFFFCNGANNKISIKTMGMTEINWALEIISWVLLIVMTIIFAVFQNKINLINELNYPQAPKNPWKTSNTVWFVICFLLLLIGYLPVE